MGTKSAQTPSLCHLCEFAVAGSLACVSFQPPMDWFQPTAVGVALGTLFAAGLCLGTKGQGRAGGAVKGFLWVCVAHFSLTRLTDLATGECLLLTTTVAGFAWLTTKMFSQTCWSYAGQAPMKQWCQLSIWDHCLVTTITVCILAGLTRVSVAQTPSRELVFVVVGGTIASLAAIHWGACRQWTFVRVILFFGLVIAFLWWIGVLQRTPFGFEQLERIVTGPMAVIWAQTATVIFFLAILRAEAKIRESNSGQNAEIHALEFQR